MITLTKPKNFIKKIIYYKNINKSNLRKYTNIFVKSGILKFKK